VSKSEIPFRARALVFDMDGLMVDSEPIARRAWERVLLDYGHNLGDDVFRRMVGLRREESARLVIEAYDLTVGAAELARQEQEAFEDEMQATGVPAMPGLMRLAGELGRRRIPWGVATSSYRAYALTVLEQLGLADACKAVAAGDEVRHGKPSPDLFLLAAERLAVSPESCMALEDSVPGCRAAVAAGMLVVAIPGDHAEEAEYDFVDHVFGSLHDVADRLDGFTG
jgi:HAD superfamily hydrolase (TIGR01509 family)